jgi:hypothetical protein
MTRPETVRVVTPVNVAEFHAVQWDGDPFPGIIWLADRFGWRFRKHAGHPNTLVIYGRNGKRYTVPPGEWVIALGTNGSIRVCTDREFRKDYREASE